MGANNFSYENRCVVVTNEDFESNNLPKLGDWININRNYPCKVLDREENKVIDKTKPIVFHEIVLTSGYYEHACLDYIRNEVYITDCLGALGFYCFKDMDTIQREIVAIHDITKQEFTNTYQQVMSDMGITEEDEDDFDKFFDIFMSEIYDIVVYNERLHCEQIIDQIKEQYGYKEYYCVGVASNGEAFYKAINN